MVGGAWRVVRSENGDRKSEVRGSLLFGLCSSLATTEIEKERLTVLCRVFAYIAGGKLLPRHEKWSFPSCERIARPLPTTRAWCPLRASVRIFRAGVICRRQIAKSLCDRAAGSRCLPKFWQMMLTVFCYRLKFWQIDSTTRRSPSAPGELLWQTTFLRV